MAPRKKAPGPAPAPALLEWGMGALGAVIVLAAAAVIVVEAWGPRAPADLSARLESARPSGDRWLAEVEVRNAGDETAAAVQIEGRLGPDVATATLDYVPAHGRERVTLAFDADPRGRADIAVAGWSEP